MYAKSISVLEFEQVEQINKRFLYSHYIGNVRVDEYEVYTTNQDVTVVTDNNISVDYFFIVDKSVCRSAGGAKFSDLVDKIEIITNDTPNSRYKKIENINP